MLAEADGASPLPATCTSSSPARDHVDRTDVGVRHARPGRVDRSRPGVPHRATRRRRHGAALRHRRRRLVRRPRRRASTTRRGRGASRLPARRRRSTLYPPALSEGAASLLPDGPAAGGRVHGARRRRRRGAPRRRRAGGRPQPGQARLRRRSTRRSPGGFAELARRIELAEDRPRRAPRRVPGAGADADDRRATTLRFRPALGDRGRRTRRCRWRPTWRSPTRCYAARHRAVPGDGRRRPTRALRRLRHTATAFGLDWPAEQSLADFERSLPTRRPACRRRSCSPCVAPAGRRRYEPYTDGRVPWHAAMAATYAHATAPLRRLADRYVIEAALAVANGAPVPERRRRRRSRRCPT